MPSGVAAAPRFTLRLRYFILFFSDPGGFGAFVQVVLIDLVLAGDNAVVIGLAAAGLSPHLRRKAIFWGIVAAALLRVVLALCAVYLLEIVGLLLAGGILLLWVALKMYQELRAAHAISPGGADGAAGSGTPGISGKVKGFGAALSQIMIADVSMSLDNVLAVAGAARDHTIALGFGLMLSVALMGLAANFIARLLNRHHWIAYLGLLIIFIVALRMIVDGTSEIALFAGIDLPFTTHGPVGALVRH